MVERHLVRNREDQPVLLQAVLGIGRGTGFRLTGRVGIDRRLAVDVGTAQAESALAAPEPWHDDYAVANVDLSGPRDLDNLPRSFVTEAGRILVAPLELRPRAAVGVVGVLGAERRRQHLDDHEVVLRVGDWPVDQFALLDAGDGNGLQAFRSPVFSSSMEDAG